ncbi:homeodomain-interacting protein kinase 1-like [Thunnus maccoyii]|uniref:homeodomain-interacting protein kinase 1-like n=1 Tax=Thunnus maccoyii TaxID=8240 RepID=UPI001C4D5146|nr:homeodomain-interacting protein kinase 1-like [Thunnus maccoyii]
MSFLSYTERDFQVHENDILSGKSCRYLVRNLKGEGSFGQVARCIKLDTMEDVAVKIIRKYPTWAGKKEASALKEVSILDMNKNNMVKFFESFKYKGHVCVVLEMLDKSLQDFVNERMKPLCVSEIRVITQQLLVALNALKGIGLVHADIKPDNVMLVNHQLQPFRVKLIDFGFTIRVSKIKRGTAVQALGYRAPEVILGLRLSEAIDMWALGCVMAFLYLSLHLYPVRCEYEIIRIIVQMQGQPDDRLLNAGSRTKDFFSKNKGFTQQLWSMKTRTEYVLATGQESQRCRTISNKYTRLDDMIADHPEPKTTTEYEDTLAFISLLKRMLRVDSVKRITPTEALGHRFITMRHFPRDTDPDLYVASSRVNMSVCPPQDSPVEINCFVTSSEVSHYGAPAVSPHTFSTATGCDDKSNAGNNDATNGAALPPSVSGHPDGFNTGSDGGYFVSVKTQAIRRFFSSMSKAMCCCSVDVVDD